jgi:hypothetical protein
MKTLQRSFAIFLGLMAYCVLVKLALTAWPGVFRSPAQAKVFEWPFLALWTALGCTGVALSERTGFPPAWDAGGAKSRLLSPSLYGIAFGVLAVATDAATGWAKAAAAQHKIATIHIDFPASALIYPGGAIIVEILYRLFLIPLLLWFFSTLLFRGRWQEETFWTLAVLTSFLEPLGDLGLRSQGYGTMAAVFLQDYALNLKQAQVFRKSGFLAAVVLRIAFYLVWHVLWGLVG